MGVKWMTVTCDECYTTNDEYEDTVDAIEGGWWFLDGPGGEFCYCSKSCLDHAVEDIPEIVVPDTYDFDEG